MILLDFDYNLIDSVVLAIADLVDSLDFTMVLLDKWYNLVDSVDFYNGFVRLII